MPIRRPDRVMLHNIPLKFVTNRVTGHRRKAVDASITLVPFIDFLIVLVVFLLTSFSATGELSAQHNLPDATNVAQIEIAPIIAIGPRVITLDGRRMASTSSLAASPQIERIEPLVQDLQTLERNFRILHPEEPFPGAVIVQADRSIDFRVIKKVMFSAGQAGYSNISFAVNRRGRAD